MDSLRGTLATLVLGVAAAIVIVALSIIPFLNPVWVGFEQDRAQAQAWTGLDDRRSCGRSPTPSSPT